MITELISEYKLLFPQKKKLLLLRAIVCYKRMINYRVVVLIRCFLREKNKNIKNIYHRKLIVKYGVEVGEDTRIGEGLKIEHINGIVIGNGAVIGNYCKIYQQVTLGQKNGKYPTVGDNVTLYPGCKVIGGIKIGDNCIVGANAVVLKDVPSNCIVAGIPAKKIGVSE